VFDSALSISALALSLIALALSLGALALHWIRREEHPDVAKIRNDVTDLTDRVEHWMRRDRTRRLRGEDQPAEPEAPAQDQPLSRAELKARLREQHLRAAK
jgi:hypothetical protein